MYCPTCIQSCQMSDISPLTEILAKCAQFHRKTEEIRVKWSEEVKREEERRVKRSKNILARSVGRFSAMEPQGTADIRVMPTRVRLAPPPRRSSAEKKRAQLATHSSSPLDVKRNEYIIKNIIEIIHDCPL